MNLNICRHQKNKLMLYRNMLEGDIDIHRTSISRFIYESEEKNMHRAHKLYIPSWNGQPVHIHDYSGITLVDVGHRLEYGGTTVNGRIQSSYLSL